MSKTPGFLKDNFFGSVSAKTSAVVLAGLMSLAPVGGKLGNIFGGTAHAQDSAEAATLPADFNKMPVSIPQGSPPVNTPETIDTSKPWERKAAYRASEGRIVLHYGEGIELADLLAEGLTERGYPTIAVPGGPKGQVELFIGKKIFGKYDQGGLDGGSLGSDAIDFFNVFVKKLPPPDYLSLAK